MKIPSYCESIGHLPKKEQIEIFNKFHKEHRDFRDSVQLPGILLVFSGSLGFSCIYAIQIEHPLIRYMSIASMGLIAFLIYRVTYKFCENTNREKFRSFLEETQSD